MEIQLKNKRALVTGGNSGIGKAISLALADAGARTAINYVANPESAVEMVKQIEDKKGEAIAIKADVSNPSEVANMFKQIEQKWGGIDILISNAGIDGERKLSWESDLENWKKVIDVNLFGAFYCSHEALKYMVTQKSGVVLNISSVHEIIAWSGYSAYTTSKAGIGMMTQTLAQEAAPYGVRVLAVGPGAVKTPINKSVWDNQKTLNDLLEKIPLNRLGTPDEIAKMVVVLVSDAASYVTGRTIFIDGGMTEYPDFSHGG